MSAYWSTVDVANGQPSPGSALREPVGLLTARDLHVLGPTFDRVWPVDETPCFADLLLAIDEADRRVWRERDRDSSL